MKGAITISRPSCGDGSKYISIRIKDKCSRISFVDIRIGYAEFTEALTGMSEMECELITRGLQNVGKQKETMPLEFLVCPKGNPIGDRKKVAKDLAIANTPNGWTPDLYFDSQKSFYHEGTELWARTNIYRYVEVLDNNNQ